MPTFFCGSWLNSLKVTRVDTQAKGLGCPYIHLWILLSIFGEQFRPRT